MKVSHSEGLSSLRRYEDLQRNGVTPNKYIFPGTLKVCAGFGDVKQGRIIHDRILRQGLESEIFIASALVDMYCKCGNITEASRLFNAMPTRNIVTWGAMIAGFAQHGFGYSALDFFSRMKDEGITPNKVTLLSALKACGATECLQKGRLLHDEAVRNGFETDLAIGNTLLVLYAKAGSLNEAHLLFDRLRGRNVVSWGALITAHVQQNQGHTALTLFEKMDFDGMKPNAFVFSCILKACGSIEAPKQGKLIHDQIIRNSLEMDTVIGSSVIDMYSSCGLLHEASFIFEKMETRNIVSWNVLICGYAHHGHSFCAIKLFEKMNLEGLKPNKATYLYILQACGDCGGMVEGKMLHGHMCDSGIEIDVVIGSSLIDMYTKCGSLEEARNVFDNIKKRNVISWSAIIRGYAYHGHDVQALELFAEMEEEGFKPDKVIFLCVLKATGSSKMLLQGTVLHDRIINAGVESDVMIGNALMHMYCNCSSLESSCKIFEKMPTRDVVSWSAMIIGHAVQGDVPAALGYFKMMQQEDIIPDRVTLLCVIKACGVLGALRQGRLIHEHIQRIGADPELAIGNALVDMYARCGSMEDSSRVFDRLPGPDVISWGAIIAGYAEQGRFNTAWEYLKQMEHQGLQPNGIMFTSILSACGRVGDVKAGHKYFHLMIDHYGILPTFEHVNCMADLFGHSGCLKEAVQLLQAMPSQPDLTGWMSLLTASRTHGNRELGQQSFNNVSQQDTTYAAGYDFIADIYANTQNMEIASRIQDSRTAYKAWKKPGKAWTEIGNDINEFIVGDKSHPQYDIIHKKLQSLNASLKDVGYLPCFDSMIDCISKVSVDTIEHVFVHDQENIDFKRFSNLYKNERESLQLFGL